MSKHFTFNPSLDFAIERFIDAPTRLVWDALTTPEHLKEWYMPKPWGRVSRAEMDVRPGGIFPVDIAVADDPEVPNSGCFLDVRLHGSTGMKRISRRTGRRASMRAARSPSIGLCST